MASLLKKNNETTQKLKNKGMRVVEMWEHEFKKLKKENSSLINFLESHEMQDRLVPRDSFFGGRTNAIQLYYEGTAKYVDFTSLYPWVSILYFHTYFIYNHIFRCTIYLIKFSTSF